MDGSFILLTCSLASSSIQINFNHQSIRRLCLSILSAALGVFGALRIVRKCAANSQRQLSFEGLSCCLLWRAQREMPSTALLLFTVFLFRLQTNGEQQLEATARSNNKPINLLPLRSMAASAAKLEYLLLVAELGGRWEAAAAVAAGVEFSSQNAKHTLPR